MDAAAMVDHCRIHQAREAEAACGRCGAVVGGWTGAATAWCYDCRDTVPTRRKARPCPYCEGRAPTRIEVGPVLFP